MSEQKVVLITGASSGIGQVTASLLTSQEFKVFGTSRNPDKDNTASFEMVQLDVCSDESVHACVQTVIERVGRLDVLINNAGYMLVGAAEETTITEAKMQFETNFFGVVRMVNTVLPIMRQQRYGQIINIGSIAGLVSTPFSSLYCASRYALEGYTESLRYEVEPFNIRVSIAELSVVKRERWDSSRRIVAQSFNDYALVRQRVIENSQASVTKSELSPMLVAKAILRIIKSKSPRLRYKIGTQAISVSLMKSFFPEAIFESMARKHFKLDNDVL